MGIDISVWRSRIGTFSSRSPRPKFVSPAILLGRPSMLLRVAVLLSLLVLSAGDVERNPGPGPGTGTSRGRGGTLSQQRLSFGEGTFRDGAITRNARLSQSSRPTPAEERRHLGGQVPAPVQHDDQYDMLQTIINNIADIGGKLDNVTEKLDREILTLRKENSALKSRVSDLEERQDILEAHSRRNNLIFYGIEEQGKETWAETETKVKAFIHDKLEMDSDDN
jgi:hypothetical protein